MKTNLFFQSGRVLIAALISLLGLLGFSPMALAQEPSPEEFVRKLAVETLETIKQDRSIASDINKIANLVDAKILPNVNFQRMTASAVGPAWRQATPEQKSRLQEEFKTLLMRTYSGALSQINDQTIVIKPFKPGANENDVVVRTEIKGKGEPIPLDYRLEKTPGQGAGWKIYDLNVLGVWLVQTYRQQFAQEINAKGLDGLIATLAERNHLPLNKK